MIYFIGNTFPSEGHFQWTSGCHFDQMTFKDFKIDETLMEEGISSFKLLKRMSQRYPRCQFTKVDVISDKCTVANACYFGAVFNCKDYEAKCQRTKFNKAVNTFCQVKCDTHSKQNLKLTFSSYLLTCEMLEFVLDWEAVKYTLKDIENLQFKDVAKSVQVRGIKEGFSMFYNTSQYETNLLLMVATKNFLKPLRVPKFTFGCNILNKSKRDEVNNIKCLLYVLLIDV